jgi:hypothetical protein
MISAEPNKNYTGMCSIFGKRSIGPAVQPGALTHWLWAEDLLVAFLTKAIKERK